MAQRLRLPCIIQRLLSMGRTRAQPLPHGGGQAVANMAEVAEAAFCASVPLDAVMHCLHECSEFEVRRVAAEALETFALKIGEPLLTVAPTVVASLNRARFDRVRPVREAVLDALGPSSSPPLPSCLVLSCLPSDGTHSYSIPSQQPLLAIADEYERLAAKYSGSVALSPSRTTSVDRSPTRADSASLGDGRKASGGGIHQQPTLQQPTGLGTSPGHDVDDSGVSPASHVQPFSHVPTLRRRPFEPRNAQTDSLSPPHAVADHATEPSKSSLSPEAVAARRSLLRKPRSKQHPVQLNSTRRQRPTAVRGGATPAIGQSSPRNNVDSVGSGSTQRTMARHSPKLSGRKPLRAFIEAQRAATKGLAVVDAGADDGFLIEAQSPEPFDQVASAGVATLLDAVGEPVAAAVVACTSTSTSTPVHHERQQKHDHDHTSVVISESDGTGALPVAQLSNEDTVHTQLLSPGLASDVAPELKSRLPPELEVQSPQPVEPQPEPLPEPEPEPELETRPQHPGANKQQRSRSSSPSGRSSRLSAVGNKCNEHANESQDSAQSSPPTLVEAAASTMTLDTTVTMVMSTTAKHAETKPLALEASSADSSAAAMAAAAARTLLAQLCDTENGQTLDRQACHAAFNVFLFLVSSCGLDENPDLGCPALSAVLVPPRALTQSVRACHCGHRCVPHHEVRSKFTVCDTSVSTGLVCHSSREVACVRLCLECCCSICT